MLTIILLCVLTTNPDTVIQATSPVVRLPLNDPLHEPTEEMLDLVKQLGSRLYVEREDASKRLTAFGLEAIVALDMACKDKDAEIVYRAKQIVNHLCVIDFPRLLLEEDRFGFHVRKVRLYTAMHPMMPPIWCIPDNIRFPEGYAIRQEGDLKIFVSEDTPVDIAKDYFVKARVLYNRLLEGQGDPEDVPIRDDVWIDEEVQEIATDLLIRDLRKHGMPIKEVRDIVMAAHRQFNNTIGHWIYSPVNKIGPVPNPLSVPTTWPE